MTEKSASILWVGPGKTGAGEISTESGALMDYPYGFANRFEDSQPGTNPEELLAAAHASCFTMAFAFACEKAGFTPTRIETQARVRLVTQDDGFTIDRIALKMEAVVPGLSEGRFQLLALSAKTNCPLSKALNAVPHITLQATLRSNAEQIAA